MILDELYNVLRSHKSGLMGLSNASQSHIHVYILVHTFNEIGRASLAQLFKIKLDYKYIRNS